MNLSDVQAAKGHNLRLTIEAEESYAEFMSSYGRAGCDCHISPPCLHCTHPGNPENLAEDDDAWEPVAHGEAS